MIHFRLSLMVRRFNSGTGALLMLLQRTPMVRLVATAESALVSPAASVLRSALLPAATLGALHTLAGATKQSNQLLANIPQPATATVGAPFTEWVTITGVGVSYAQSWSIDNALPPGITAQGAALQGGQLVISPSQYYVLYLSGTPTTPGTYTVNFSGYEFPGLTGPVTTASATFVVSPAPNSKPAITRQPSDVTTVVGGGATLTLAFMGVPDPAFQWSKDGAAIPGATNASLELDNVTVADAGSYDVTLTNSLGSTTSDAAQVVVEPAPVAPAFMAPPVSQVATAGGDVVFTVVVTGTPTPTLQWMKNGADLVGATDTSLVLSRVVAADAGAYAVMASSLAGTAVSATAKLTVNPAPSAPVFTASPNSQTVAVGSTVVFSAPAIGTPAPTYQWQRNGVNLVGATSAMLVINNASAAEIGDYTSVVTNSLGTQTTPAAPLGVIATNDPGRLVNLSVNTVLGTGEIMTVGTVLGGNGTSGTKPLLVRAGGPALVQLGLTGVLPDPTITLINTTVPPGVSITVNNDWGGTPALLTAFAQVAAFPYVSANSKDAAIAQTLGVGSYSVQVSDAGAGTGTVIAELYDETPSGSFKASTPRLINVSVRKPVPTGGVVTLGFFVGGSTGKTVLIRGIGPGLAQFGVTDAMADPKLTLYSSSGQVIAANDDWGGDPQITAAGNRVAAFAISNAASKDAMLLITLPSGTSYIAQVSPVGAGGSAIVEVYEIP